MKGMYSRHIGGIGGGANLARQAGDLREMLLEPKYLEVGHHVNFAIATPLLGEEAQCVPTRKECWLGPLTMLCECLCVIGAFNTLVWLEVHEGRLMCMRGGEGGA